ncbi:MAG: hypothetical protein AAGI38_06930 [Bacteroidota bacterium]
MSSFRTRPRFQQVLPLTSDQISQRLQRRIQEEGAPFKGTFIRDYVVLRVQEEDRHFWSPQLSLSMEEAEEGGTLIYGLYGPNPTIWVLMLFGYSVLGIFLMFGAIIGFAQMNLGKDAPILYALPIFIAGIIGLYMVGQTGQKLGAEQTFELKQFYEETIGERTHIS